MDHWSLFPHLHITRHPVTRHYPGRGWGGVLPAVGYRDYTNGTLTRQSTDGFYWSSSVNGSYGYDLYFNSGGSYLDTSPKAGGFSVRCVKK